MNTITIDCPHCGQPVKVCATCKGSGVIGGPLPYPWMMATGCSDCHGTGGWPQKPSIEEWRNKAYAGEPK